MQHATGGTKGGCLSFCKGEKKEKKKACGNEKLAASHFSSFSLDGEVEGECLGIARKQQSLLGTLRLFDLPSRAICLLDWTGLDGKACTVASLDGRSRVQKRKDEKKKKKSDEQKPILAFLL